MTPDDYSPGEPFASLAEMQEYCETGESCIYIGDDLYPGSSVRTMLLNVLDFCIDKRAVKRAIKR